MLQKEPCKLEKGSLGQRKAFNLAEQNSRILATTTVGGLRGWLQEEWWFNTIRLLARGTNKVQLLAEGF